MNEGRQWPTIVLKGTALAALLSFAVWANLQASEQETLRQTVVTLGYPGLLAASVISGFNLIVPIPVIAFFPLLIESGFTPIPTLLTIAFGMTGGDFLGYVIGNASRDIVGDRMSGIRSRVEDLHDKHPFLPLGFLLFYAAFVPLPNELVVIPLAFLRYSLLGIMCAVFFGNIVFNSLAAYGVTRVFSIGG